MKTLSVMMSNKKKSDNIIRGFFKSFKENFKQATIIWLLLLFLAVWLARRLGVSFETETMAETYILRIFTVNTPLSLLSFLQ